MKNEKENKEKDTEPGSWYSLTVGIFMFGFTFFILAAFYSTILTDQGIYQEFNDLYYYARSEEGFKTRHIIFGIISILSGIMFFNFQERIEEKSRKK